MVLRLPGVSGAGSHRRRTTRSGRLFVMGLHRGNSRTVLAVPLLVAQEVPREPTEIRLRWRSTGCVGVTRHPEHRPREAEMAEAVVSCSG
jgi:hypothetical protein